MTFRCNEEVLEMEKIGCEPIRSTTPNPCFIASTFVLKFVLLTRILSLYARTSDYFNLSSYFKRVFLLVFSSSYGLERVPYLRHMYQTQRPGPCYLHSLPTLFSLRVPFCNRPVAALQQVYSKPHVSRNPCRGEMKKKVGHRSTFMVLACL